MDPQPTFRRAIEADLPAIVAMMLDDAISAARDGLSAVPDLEPYREAFRRIEALPGNELLVMELEGRVVGTCQLTFIPGLSRAGRLRCLVEAVRVEAASRNRGLGAALMAHVQERARAEGCTLVQLTTDKRRTDAHRFYQRLGFVASHEGMKLYL
jgi:GNAT superfamily N-acetyltransferase